MANRVDGSLEPTGAAPAADFGRPDGLGITPDMQRGCKLAALVAAYRSVKYVQFTCCMLDQDVHASCLRIVPTDEQTSSLVTISRTVSFLV